VDRRLDIAARQEAQRVASVDSQTTIKGFRPLPGSCLRILDLQRCHGLAEQQRQRAQVRVASDPDFVVQFPELLELVALEACVLHVPQVRLVVRLPPVQVDQVVFRQLQGNGDEVVERREHLVVEVFGKGFDLCPPLRQQVGEQLGDVSIPRYAPKSLDKARA
jgi:hypothetical protein